MSNISSYVLTIAGVILISVVIELVMSDGQMNKYIKNIFSFFVVAVIIAPLPKLISNESISSVFDYEEYQIQQEYISSLNNSKINVLINETQLELGEDGYHGVVVNVTLQNNEITSISIGLKDLIIQDIAEHKNIEEIKKVISSKVKDKFNVKEEIIKYED